MYGEIHAAVADHFFVGGVDDGVNGEVGYVLADDLEGHGFRLLSLWLDLSGRKRVAGQGNG
jgi:hypothetical protein